MRQKYIRIKHFQILISTFMLFFPILVFGQNLTELKKEADTFFKNNRFKDALFSYKQYQQEKPGNKDVLLNLGICNYQLGKGTKALEYLEYVFSQNTRNPKSDVFFYLAKTHHGLHHFQDAVIFYKSYLKNTSAKDARRKLVIENIKRCLSGMNIKENPEVALVENFGALVNTEGDEFAALPSINHAGRIYFSAAQPNSTGGRRAADGIADTKAGRFCSDMYFVDSDHSGWFYPERLNDLLNTSRHEIALGFNEDGKVLYYFRGFTQYGGDLWTDTSGTKDEHRLNQLPFQSPIEMHKGDAAPFFFKDSILFFSSRRTGGFGGLDIYYAIRRADSTWTQAVNLGPTVNSAYDDTHPFMTEDGRTLYFSSNRAESIGGLDIFRTQYIDLKRGWSAVQNLGLPINSAGDEGYFRLDKSTEKAYFSSNRLGGYGQRDLYVTYYKEPRKTENTSSIPLFFATVDATPMLLIGNNGTGEQAVLPFESLQYNKDEDLLQISYQKIYREIAELATAYPSSKVVVTVHTDDSGPLKFDLYYGIKRSELIGNALQKAGLSARQIVLRSGGSNFPQAREVLEMQTNETGKALNKRAVLSLKSIEALPVRTEIKRPDIFESMQSPKAKAFETKTKGLYFKVFVTATRQILNSDVLAMFDDVMIESTPGSGDYRYTAGLYATVKEANRTVRELNGQGFPDAFVLAYVNDVPVAKADAKKMLKKYPELKPYINQK